MKNRNPRFFVACIVLAGGLALGIFFGWGCDPQSRPHPIRPAPSKPSPVSVPAFSRDAPDALLLLTGDTHGMMEVCNCSGPMPGGLARRSGLVLSYQAAYDNTLLLDTGDLFWIDPTDLRNVFVARGYADMGYDVVVPGDQEWAAPNGFLARAFPRGEMTYLSSTVGLTEGQPPMPLTNVVKREFPGMKLAIVSRIRRESFLFFDKNRLADLMFTPVEELRQEVSALKAEGYAVVVVVHGDSQELQHATRELPADLFIRGHAQKAAEKLLRENSKPVVQTGGSEFVCVAALWSDGRGGIAHVDYRREMVDDRWPLDKRMLELYQAYAHQAMRQALDAEREKTIAFVPSRKCGQCHEKEYQHWKNSRHARAYVSLQEVGRTGDPNCVGCHTLGFGAEGGFYTISSTPRLAGVHCQSCHRFGLAEHKKARMEKHPRKPISAETCKQCHTPVTDPHFRNEEAEDFHQNKAAAETDQ